MRIVFFCLLLALSPNTFAQQDAEDARRAIAAIDDALKQRPADPALYFYLARFQAELGDASASAAALEKVDALGDGFLPARHLGFDKVWDDPKFQEVRAHLEARLPRLDYAPTAFELEDRGLIPEGIAHDTPSHSFFVGSIARGKIVRLNADGGVVDFATRLDPVLGIAVDAPRRKLYAVTTSALTEAGRKEPRNAVYVYDVDSGNMLRRVEVPGAAQLNDVTVAFGGRVFASDSGNGAIYEIPAEGAARVLVAAGQLRGSNGLAASADAKRLYVAHSTGLAVIDLAGAGGVKRVTNATRENIAAIDGLYEWQGQLIGVQNVTNPGRVILITLSSDGASAMRVQTLLSHHHNVLDEPTAGAIDERGFFLLAATGVRHYNARGTLDDADSLPKPAVVRVLLPR
jgi:SMP-30/Gluconolactonase/LRE-like region